MSQNYTVSVCLFVVWGVCFVLFLSAMCGIPGRYPMPALEAQNLETKKQPRMALKETQSGQPKPSEGTLIVFLGLQLP